MHFPGKFTVPQKEGNSGIPTVLVDELHQIVAGNE